MKKFAKVVVAAAALAAVTAAFFGVKSEIFCRIQPVATYVFLVVLLLAPLVGRLFCECLCPLGIIQSVVNWIFHPRTKVRRVCTRLPEKQARQFPQPGPTWWAQTLFFERRVKSVPAGQIQLHQILPFPIAARTTTSAKTATPGQKSVSALP